ncbi:glycosyltransferase [Mucilaginibacter flavus]|uniref:glycosyltransferase n=1 Tax=Mucilaginibacter flavus TaxID=931504 RepID=UPI0025B37510|nr:glycosyltransferase [Mucilaginibacter flavus]MDN3584417.1 glycosyltransferase [Mucilaginibacter flavus]
MIKLSVIIPTYNPDIGRLRRTLDALKNQTLPISSWELVIIDNHSPNDFSGQITTAWQHSSRIVREERPGLTFARIRGCTESTGDIIVFVDDDNLLAPDYLEKTLNIFEVFSNLGAVGGKSFPIFEGPEPAWLRGFYGNLALRDLGDEIILSDWDQTYPSCAPVGAGMAVKRSAIAPYVAGVMSGGSLISDRKGDSLSSGGDNDIVLHVLKNNLQVGYFPDLQLLHIIPEARTKVHYIARLINNTNKSWIQLLERHQINPWPLIDNWTVPFRKMKAWFTYKSWKDEVSYIRWRGACGTFEGLAKSNYVKRKVNTGDSQ